MGNRKSGDVNSTAPGIGEPFDAVGCEDQVEIEWSIFQLNEIFPAQHVAFLADRKLCREIRKTGSVKLLETVAAPANEDLHIQWLVIGAVLIAAAIVLLRLPRRSQPLNLPN